jgi:hypothetical protein
MRTHLPTSSNPANANGARGKQEDWIGDERGLPKTFAIGKEPLTAFFASANALIPIAIQEAWTIA